MGAESWAAFKPSFEAALGTAEKLKNRVAEGPAPYALKYDAAGILADTVTDIERLQSGWPEADAGEVNAAKGLASTLRGLILLETDHVEEGEAATLRGVQCAEMQARLDKQGLIIRANNALAALWSGRGDDAKALHYLDEAREAYERFQRSLSVTAEDPQMAKVQKIVRDNHTMTAYYQAQVYGKLGEAARAAECCAETLSGQLELEEMQPSIWVTDCTGLASYFTAQGEFALPEHLLNAAQHVLQQLSSDGERCEAAAVVALGRAEMHAARLKLSVKRLKGQDVRIPGMHTTLPSSMRFAELALPPEETLLWGDKALATDEKGATEIFNTAMRHFKEALEFYKLEHAASQHAQIVISISATLRYCAANTNGFEPHCAAPYDMIQRLHRCLAELEPDEHRRSVLHRQRVKRLQPVLDALCPTAFTALCRQLHLEAAEALRDIMDAKRDAGRPHSKVAAAAAEAKVHMDAYLDAFRPAGALPKKINAEDEEQILNACFQMGRVMNALQPPQPIDGDTKCLEAAAHHYQYIVEYAKRNDVDEACSKMAQACSEMAELVVDNIRHIRFRAQRK